MKIFAAFAVLALLSTSTSGADLPIPASPDMTPETITTFCQPTASFMQKVEKNKAVPILSGFDEKNIPFIMYRDMPTSAVVLAKVYDDGRKTCVVTVLGDVSLNFGNMINDGSRNANSGRGWASWRDIK